MRPASQSLRRGRQNRPNNPRGRHVRRDSDKEPNGKAIATALARIEEKVKPIPALVRHVAALPEQAVECETTLKVQCPQRKAEIKDNRDHINALSNRVWGIVIAVGIVILSALTGVALSQ